MFFDLFGTQRILDAIKASEERTAARITSLKDLIMASNAELAQQLRDITAQNEKSRAEVLAKIKDLEDALANAGTTPEVDEAVAALKASVQTDDDIVPDQPPA